MESLSDAPPNIQEFNAVAGLVFAQLYRSFPIHQEITNQGIADAMGLTGSCIEHQLPSGRRFKEVADHTVNWLMAEDYIRRSGRKLTLTTKGLTAMNAVPSGLKQSVGKELTDATTERDGSRDLSRIGDLIGGMLGGFTKSVAS
jgi:hypothetical protein